MALRPENSLAFNAITEAFLARHLGGRAEPVGDDFKGSSHEIRAGNVLLQALLEGPDQPVTPNSWYPNASAIVIKSSAQPE